MSPCEALLSNTGNQIYPSSLSLPQNIKVQNLVKHLLDSLHRLELINCKTIVQHIYPEFKPKCETKKELVKKSVQTTNIPVEGYKDRKDYFLNKFIAGSKPAKESYGSYERLKQKKKGIVKPQPEESVFSRGSQINPDRRSKRIIKQSIARVPKRETLSKPTALLNITTSDLSSLQKLYSLPECCNSYSEKTLGSAVTQPTVENSADEGCSKTLNSKPVDFSMFDSDVIALSTPVQKFNSLPANLDCFKLD